jgi:Phage Terminase
MVEYRQGFRSMAAPTRELEKLIVSKKLAHGGNPVTRWMAANVAVAQDPAGNLKPALDKSIERIDGIVATINGHRPRHRRPGRAAALVPDVGLLRCWIGGRCRSALLVWSISRAKVLARGSSIFAGISATIPSTDAYAVLTRARSTKATHSCAVPRAGDRGAQGQTAA